MEISNLDSKTLRESRPQEDMPREKLYNRGRQCLSDEELLAIFLRTGVRGCNVLELASLLMKKAGSLAELGQMEAADICSLVKGIGMAKAATLAAVFELGQRAARAKLNRCEMRSGRDVYDYLAGELRFETQEVLYVLLLDARSRLMRAERIATGTLTRVITHARNVYSLAVRFNAFKIIMAHNHPSGSTNPSEHDKNLTHAIAEAGEVLGIPLMDHVIIGAADAYQGVPYFSFAEHGLLRK